MQWSTPEFIFIFFRNLRFTKQSTLWTSVQGFIQKVIPRILCWRKLTFIQSLIFTNGSTKNLFMRESLLKRFLKQGSMLCSNFYTFCSFLQWHLNRQWAHLLNYIPLLKRQIYTIPTCSSLTTSLFKNISSPVRIERRKRFWIYSWHLLS